MLKRLLSSTVFKFAIVGVVNTAIGTTVMLFCYNLLHFNYWFSTAMNYVTGSMVSYFLNKYYTFQNKERNWKIVLRFIINIIVCYLLAYGIAKPLVASLLAGRAKAIQENGAMLVGMVLFMVLNYFGQRFFAFKQTGSDLQ